MTPVMTSLETVRHNDAALEIIQQAGGRVATRALTEFAERDWEAEMYLDVWVGKYASNVAEHYHEILRAPHIGPLKNALSAKPCAVAVVGAGPSLDRNAEVLHDFPGIIIACDRAAKALTARNIKPDMVVCVDPRPAVMAEMLNYPENREQVLILSVLADPEVPRVWRGKKFYMSTLHPGTQFFDRVLPELFPGMPMLFACGNVGNTAVQMAEWLGAKKIVLVGQDYGYTGGRVACDDWVRFPNGAWARARRTAAEDAILLAKRTGKIMIEDVETYGPFVSYRDTLAEMAREWKLDVVNATEGGIIKVFPQQALSDVAQDLRAAKYQAKEAHALLDKATGGIS